MRGTALNKTSIVGAAVAAICCATTALALALGALGLSAWLARADAAVPAALAAFVLLAGHGFHRRRSADAGVCCETSGTAAGAATSPGRNP